MLNQPLRCVFSFANSLAAATVVAIFVVGAPADLSAADITWEGNTSANWNEANWLGVNNPPASGDALFFGAAGGSGTNLVNNFANGTSFSGITFNAGASAYTFSPNWTRLTGNITNNSTATQTLNLGHELSSNVAFNAAAGNLIFGVNNSINLNGHTLTVTGDYNTTINLGVGGGGANSKIIKEGAGTLTFGGGTGFQGGLTINEGTVNGRTFANLASNAIVVNDTGKLIFNVHDAFGNDGVTVLAPVTINAGGIVESNNTFTSLGPLNLNGGTLVDNGGANGNYGAFKLQGTVTVGGSAASSISSAGGSNKGIHLVNTTFNVGDAVSGADLTISAALRNRPGGAASVLTKTGPGTLVLSGANNYTGATNIDSGELLLHGTHAGGGVYTVASGAAFGGTGTTASLIQGAGYVSPGASPGILTVGQIDPSAGMDYSFEFTAPGDPNWASATNSVNDVLRVTAPTPFVNGPFDANNNFDIYLNVSQLNDGEVFRGGLFTDLNADFLTAIDDAVFNYFVSADGGGSMVFEGENYYTLDEYALLENSLISLDLETVAAAANFADGTVNGRVMQFSVNAVELPEPASIAAWMLLGIAGLVFGVRKMRRK